ncbi:LuxR family transcriptional regulator [Pseudomonas sp. WS 5532]|uniref:LuxR family transcriptional regulator n=1 Tax=Pseudomonas edaphica TaxID=2006980 RepID=A0A7Y8E966_9PSED|nr:MULTISPECIES: LuxR C-terminal-related transcriptional regulator [Pseudomonas]MCF5144575.1 LuxR family transcriptional regulator [Pseudomonas sp. PA-6-3C]MCF5150834.1 LuxR family transcriptional regulator [Pseudomonas sp. PA-6-3F]MCF5162219.1 LuxR family transcriptional regulator [Pseudomonas sp. PA-6-2E]MCF5178361.1 LuxR family transcriptional regulator [Pseudomonas sp. PA-6-1D]MCF5195491.1 LuxR family transcriptional regulator [Pseudomonas sp. PA-6-1H]
MNSHLFPHIGKVIASTGSRHFPRMLHDLILTQLAVDATHITQLQVSAEGHTRRRISPVYTDSVTALGEEQPAAQLHLTRRKDDVRYVLSVYRSHQSESFSPQERSMLEDFSTLLLPMVEKHITAIQPCRQGGSPVVAENQGLETLRRRIEERLVQSGLTLSNRELDVCVGLLAGRTAPELAEQLALKVNTIESYLKRAAIKLGISGRHSLLRWMYAGDEGVATAL